MFTIKRFGVLAWVLLCCFPPSPPEAFSKPARVLVVMSYERDFPWCADIEEGVRSVLPESCHIRLFYMDTKKNLAGGAEKAKEAFSVFKTFKPDGVIAADDNAQSMFVVPYLKNRVQTPVMFCGVNAEPERYGYPADNVSGILERPHFNESFAFVQQLVPSVKSVGFIIKESPTGRAHYNQTRRETEAYPVTLSAFKMPRTVEELVSMTRAIGENSDALLLAALAGVLDASGRPITEKEGIKIALETFGPKPVVGAESYTVNYGALCAVVRTGQEQGETAARMLLRAMGGMPVSRIPVTRNSRGKRIINATTMKALGIKPRPDILRGAELVRTEE